MGNWFEWPVLKDFGDNCKLFAILSGLGFLWLLKSKAEPQENEPIGQALFGPKTLMNNTVNNYGINYGNQAAGQSVHQQAKLDAVAINQRINSLVEQVEAEAGLDAARKREATAELNTLAEQTKLPPAQREPSKVLRALKLLPGLLSSINALAQEWDKLEPWIRSHFGNI